MAISVAKQQEIVGLLRELVGVDRGAVAAYDAAIVRARGVTERAAFSNFRDDHRRHIDVLSEQLRALGVDASREAAAVLPRDGAFVSGLGDDPAIVAALLVDEGATGAAYERAVARGDLPMHLRDIVLAHLGDERRHRTWLEARMQTQAARPSASA